MKTPPMKAKGAKIGKPPSRRMTSKPHIRMQKLKPISPGAFPTTAAAFPTNGAPPGPDAAISAQSGGMPSGAAPGDMTE